MTSQQVCHSLLSGFVNHQSDYNSTTIVTDLLEIVWEAFSLSDHQRTELSELIEGEDEDAYGTPDPVCVVDVICDYLRDEKLVK